MVCSLIFCCQKQCHECDPEEVAGLQPATLPARRPLALWLRFTSQPGSQ